MPAPIIDQINSGMFNPSAGFSDPGTPPPGGYTQSPRSTPITPATSTGQFNMNVGAGLDDLESHRTNWLSSKGLITPTYATAGFYAPINNEPRPYTGGIPDGYGPPQSFGHSLGIGPDKNALIAKDADNAAFRARNPTAPVSDYGSANYRERVGSMYQTAIDSLGKQNDGLVSPTPDMVAAAKAKLGQFDRTEANTRTSMALANPMARVESDRAANHMGPVIPGEVPPDMALHNLQRDRATDNATLGALPQMRAPYQRVIDADTPTGRFSANQKIMDNLDSIDRLQKHEFVEQPPRTPQEEQRLGVEREHYAQGKDAEAANARGEIFRRNEQNDARQGAINSAIATRGVDPRTFKTLTDAQLHANHDAILNEINLRNNQTRAQGDQAHAAATTRAAQTHANATTQAADIHGRAAVEAAKARGGKKGDALDDARKLFAPTTQPTAPGNLPDLTDKQDEVDKLPSGSTFLWNGKPHKKV